MNHKLRVITKQLENGDMKSIITAFGGDVPDDFKEIHLSKGAIDSHAEYYIERMASGDGTFVFNQAGHNTGESSSKGRSLYPVNWVILHHYGKGDAAAYNANVLVVHDGHEDNSHHDNAAGVVLNGQVFTIGDNCYANVLEFLIKAYGDSTATGLVFNFDRPNAAKVGKHEKWWDGIRLQSLRTACDVAFKAVGRWLHVLDCTTAKLDGNQAAITLAAGQRIYFNATKDQSGYSLKPDACGGTWIESNEAGHLKFYVNGELKLELK